MCSSHGLACASAGPSSNTSGSAHFGSDAILDYFTQLRSASGLGSETLQSQLQAISQSGADFTRQANQILHQLPQQLHQSFALSETTSALSAGLSRLQQSLSQGPAGASAAFNDFTANFHWHLGSAGMYSLSLKDLH